MNRVYVWYAHSKAFSNQPTLIPRDVRTQGRGCLCVLPNTPFGHPSTFSNITARVVDYIL